MRCGSTGVTTIMLGLYRVGIIRLPEAIRRVSDSGATERDRILELLVDELRKENYIPERDLAGYRKALWREWLRHRGEDFGDFFSEVEVTVRGEPGEELDQFLATMSAVFAEFELAPMTCLLPTADVGPNPQLIIHEHVVVAGRKSREAFRSAVRKSFSDW